MRLVLLSLSLVVWSVSSALAQTNKTFSAGLIPGQFHGKWAPSLRECSSNKIVIEGRTEVMPSETAIVVTPKGFGGFERGSTVLNAISAQEGSFSYRARASAIEDGRIETLTFREVGNQLSLRRKSTSYDFVERFIRCPSNSGRAKLSRGEPSKPPAQSRPSLLGPKANMARGPEGFERIGTCRLKIGGRLYISGTCYFSTDKDGSFNLMGMRGDYFAYVSLNGDGSAQGYWNGGAGFTHAHSSLGRLHRKGACWSNAKAEVCVWA